MTSVEIQKLKEELHDLKDLAADLDAATAKVLELIYLFSTPHGLRSGKCKRGHDVTTHNSLYVHNRRAACKKCIVINRKEYYQKNREKILFNHQMRNAGKKKW